eukprot:TRINITY_DN1840_c0_g1_i2.p1 TRINITY_DN1840_c0_g1~~TRINITY_DN1840_c0_g1_i2.p1  ORF type:complete len:181 (-),score=16.18 TRINITY_DN1840_c0_g1_i2:59-580(-)
MRYCGREKVHSSLSQLFHQRSNNIEAMKIIVEKKKKNVLNILHLSGSRAKEEKKEEENEKYGRQGSTSYCKIVTILAFGGEGVPYRISTILQIAFQDLALATAALINSFTALTLSGLCISFYLQSPNFSQRPPLQDLTTYLEETISLAHELINGYNLCWIRYSSSAWLTLQIE